MKKLFLIFLLGIFFLSFTSASILDSKKIIDTKTEAFTLDKKVIPYNDLWIKYKPLEINNLFGKTKFSGAITQHTESCGIDCFSTMEIYTSGDDALIDDVIFKTLQDDGSWIEQNIRSYQFYVKTGGTQILVDDYKTICEDKISLNGTTYSECNRVKSGSHYEESPEWTQFNLGDKFKEGTYTIKLEGQKKPSRTVDWIIITSGKILDEWATWEGSDLDDGLVSYYKLDETSGTVIDSLGINNGTNNGATPNVAGKINTAYDFDGTNDYVNGVPEIPYADFTINAWVNLDSTAGGGYRTIYGQREAGDGNPLMQFRTATGMLGIEMRNNAGEGYINNYTTTNNLTGSGWAMATVTYDVDTGDIDVYINGSNVLNTTYTGGTWNDVDTIQIGAGFYGSIENGWDGKIDEVGIWNRTLTSSEILNSLYNSGNGLSYPSGQASVTLNSPADASISSTTLVTTNSTATVTRGATLKNVTLYDNSTGTWGARNSTDIIGTTNTTAFDNTYTGGQTYLWNHLWCDSDGDCGFATSNFTFSIDSTAPTIDLISPNSTYNYLKQGDTLYLQGFANDSNLDTVWYEYNGTNTTFSATTATLFNESIQADSSKLSLTVWANDTIGNTNREVISWDYKVFENDRIYSLNAYETEMKDFIINLTYNSSTFVPTVYLNYDGTNYSTINIGSGNEGKFKNTVSIGLIDGSTSKEFYWWILANDSVIKTESNNQTINNLIFQICNGTYTNKTLNFKFYDESKNTLLNSTLNPLTFETYFEFWVGNGDIKKSYNYNVQNTTTGSYDFCISPANFSFNSNLQISYSVEDYSKRESSYNELNLTNIIQNISFYLLPTELSTKFTHYVRQEIEALAGVSVEVYKFLISTGNYTLISTKTTDENGRFVEWLELDQKYKYTVKSEGISLTEQEKQAICAVSPCEITLQIDEVSLNAFNELNAYFAQNVDYNLTYNKSTSTFKLSFLDLTGNANYWRLYVYKSNSNNDTLNSICNLYAYSSSGELECDTSLYFGEITAKVYISRSPEKLVDFLIRVNENITPVLSVSGLLASIIILLVIIFTGTRNPTSALLMLPFGLIILKFIGFMPLTWGWIAGITIFILAISYKMNT